MSAKPTSSAQQHGRMAYAIRETLITLVSINLADSLIEHALRKVGQSSIPEGGAALSSFMDTLGKALHDQVSPDAAAAFLADVAPIVALADSEKSSVRKSSAKALFEAAEETFDMDIRTEPSHPALQVIPSLMPSSAEIIIEAEESTSELQLPVTIRPLGNRSTNSQPLVVVLSRDQEGLRRITEVVSRSASVHHATDTFGLLEGVGSLGYSSLFLVIDCRMQLIGLDTLLQIVSNLPHDTHVLLWGVSKSLQAELENQKDSMTEAWLYCDEEAQPSDVAALCRTVLG